MDIRSAVRFVKGACTAGAIMELRNGRITAGSASMTLSSPVLLAVNASPNAAQLCAAIDRAKDGQLQITHTSGGRLCLQSGKFRAYVECTTLELPIQTPEGAQSAITAPLLPVLEQIAPFIADASVTTQAHAWAAGALFRHGSVFATNSAVLVAAAIGLRLPKASNVPGDAIKELLRIGEEPNAVLSDERSISFIYPGGQWARFPLYDTKWPNLDQMLATIPPLASVPPVDPALFVAAKTLEPFCDSMGRLFVANTNVRTSINPDEGASVELPVQGGGVVFNCRALALAGKIAKRMDLQQHGGRGAAFYNEDGTIGGILSYMRES